MPAEEGDWYWAKLVLTEEETENSADIYVCPMSHRKPDLALKELRKRHLFYFLDLFRICFEAFL